MIRSCVGHLSHTVSPLLARRSAVAYLEDSPRVILVVGDAAVAHSPLSHDAGVEAGIGERRAVAGMALAACNELIDCSIPPVLLLDLAVSAASHKQEEASTGSPSEDYEADDDACGNGGLVGRCFGLARLRGGLSDNDSLTCCLLDDHTGVKIRGLCTSNGNY